MPAFFVLLLLLGLAAGGSYMALTGRMRGPRWTRLLPETKRMTLELLKRAEAAGLQVMFFEGWRDPTASAKNIAAGTSKLSDPFNSMHVWGAAVDIVFKNAAGLPHWPSDRDPRWKQLAEIGESVGFRSGGKMWGWDWPHFQLPGISTVELRSRYGNDYLAYLQTKGVPVTTTA